MQVEVIGYIAAFLTTFSFIPQVIHIFKTKDTSAISLGMYSAFVLGVASWLVYGVMLKDLPMILANTITLILAIIILGYKIYHRIKNVD